MPVGKENFKVITNKKSGKGELIISGYINPYNDNSAAAIRKSFKELEDEYSEIDIYLLNCYGGSVFEGLPVVNYILHSKAKVNTICEGLAASMGAILFLAGHKRYMAKNSRLMLHRAMAGIYGDADQIKDYGATLEDTEKDLVTVIVDASNLTDIEVKSKFMNTGKDVYLNFAMAKKYELVHGEVKGIVKEDLPEDVANMGLDSISNYYEQQISNSINIEDMDQKELAISLGLPENATKTEINAKIEALKAIEAKGKGGKETPPTPPNNSTLDEATEQRLKNLEASLSVERTQKVENLVNSAIEAKKINADQKETYIKLATSDYDAAKDALSSMQPAVKPTDFIGAPSNGKELPADKKNWTFANYMENESEALVTMKAENFDLYAKLYEAEYGAKPERS